MRTRLAVVGVFAIAVLTVPLTAAFGAPTLTLNVNAGVPGSSFTVSVTDGEGCQESLPLSADVLAEPDLATVDLAVDFSPTPVHQSFAANSNGTWSTVVTVPADTEPGPYTVQATCTQVGTTALDITYPFATYTVTAPVAAVPQFGGPEAAAPEAVVAAPSTTG